VSIQNHTVTKWCVRAKQYYYSWTSSLELSADRPQTQSFQSTVWIHLIRP